MNIKLLAVVGKKHSGKDTIFQTLKNHLYPKTKVLKLAFADEMKKECSKATGVPLDKMEEQKELFRPLWQWWGTDFRRKGYDAYWTDKWLFNLRKIQNESKEDTLVICTDVRFLNEALLVTQINGKLWKIVREQDTGKAGIFDHNPSVVDPTSLHKSETELEQICASTIIYNNTTLKAFESEIIMNYETWIKKAFGKSNLVK